MNGVSRGGRGGHLAMYIRCSMRWVSYGLVTENKNVGFRSEWCR